MAAKANIVVDQGTTFTTALNLTDDNDQAIDLTGYTVEAQIRKWYTSSNSVSFAVTVPTPSNGVINLSLTANVTSAMDYGRYVYDVISITDSGTVTRIVEGILTVTPEVTTVMYP
jgi:LEA14-like dessication related protein